MIPKIIHYCWFGNNKLPESAQKCIESWKKYCPGYEIKRWDETNIDLDACAYIREAYDAKKWAFVSDYARFWVLYNYGGLYFDTDVELIRSIEDVVVAGGFMAIEQPITEDGRFFIASGLGLGCEKGSEIIKEILDSYNDDHFVNDSGMMQSYTVVHRVTDIMEKHGYQHKNEEQKVSDITVYPWEYFCPMNYNDGKITIRDQTRAIHHYDMTWKTEEEVELKTKERQFRSRFGNSIGFFLFRCYRFIYKHM